MDYFIIKAGIAIAIIITFENIFDSCLAIKLFIMFFKEFETNFIAFECFMAIITLILFILYFNFILIKILGVIMAEN